VELKEKVLCIYHGNCLDGFSAAWVVRKYYGEDNVEFFPASYGGTEPEVTDRSVIMVDFSYKRSKILEMAKKAKNILIIDHHQSAEENLKRKLEGYHDLPENVETVFDMEQSGCVLTWEYFFNYGKQNTADHGNQINTPHLLLHIQDRDLWKFSMSDSKNINMAMFSYQYDFGLWDSLTCPDTEFADMNMLEIEGEAIQRKFDKDLNELLPMLKREMLIGGHKVYAANLPYMFASEGANKLSEGMPFGATFYDKPGERVFSLRSKSDGIDVAKIAEEYGGGGHKHASGFSIKKSISDINLMS
jgi:oligoribonuclease NrnB/cAMP/cGMP phosphodiesterase (DHH superfamily)